MRYKVRKKLQLWLKDNGYDDVKVIRDKEFYCDVREEPIIAVGQGIDAASMSSFQRLCDKYELEHDCYWTTLSFLHELGHYNTEDEWSQAWDTLYVILNTIIENIIRIFPNMYKPMNYIYQRLPQEEKATRWAIEFANENPEQTKELNEIFGTL